MDYKLPDPIKKFTCIVFHGIKDLSESKKNKAPINIQPIQVFS